MFPTHSHWCPVPVVQSSFGCNFTEQLCLWKWPGDLPEKLFTFIVHVLEICSCAGLAKEYVWLGRLPGVLNWLCSTLVERNDVLEDSILIQQSLRLEIISFMSHYFHDFIDGETSTPRRPEGASLIFDMKAHL